MIFRYKPGPPLESFVEHFWLDDAFHRPYPREKILPTGTLDLVIDLGSDGLAMLSGAWSSPLVFQTGPMRPIMGVGFRPGGAAPFLDMPAGELRDCVVPLADLWGRRPAGRLEETLGEAQAPMGRFEALELSLISRLDPRRTGGHPAVALALEEFGDGTRSPSVRAVARRLGLSDRRLIELFRNEVGLAPKRYCRVRRFTAAVAASSVADPDWAGIALACGYCDQAHLIRDFWEFAGQTPGAYLAARGVNPYHRSAESA